MDESLHRIATALGGNGRPSAKGWYTCRCPTHTDRHPSLAIGIGRSGRIFVHCFAGCDSTLIVENLRLRGLWSDARADSEFLSRVRTNSEAYRLERFIEARRIWRETVPLELTPGEDYLRRLRAIALDPGPRLRWHWRMFAVVALMTDPISDCATGVRITPLNRLTHRRERNRLVFGQTGVVRLLDGPGELVVGEGVETTLSGAEIVGARAAWAAGPARSLASLRLPLGIREVALLVDHDPAGEDGCRQAAARLRAADPSRTIRLLRPRPPHNDFNDLARRRGS